MLRYTLWFLWSSRNFDWNAYISKICKTLHCIRLHKIRRNRASLNLQDKNYWCSWFKLEESRVCFCIFWCILSLNSRWTNSPEHCFGISLAFAMLLGLSALYMYQPRANRWGFRWAKWRRITTLIYMTKNKRKHVITQRQEHISYRNHTDTRSVRQNLNSLNIWIGIKLHVVSQDLLKLLTLSKMTSYQRHLSMLSNQKCQH